jgi:hypothetical protein
MRLGILFVAVTGDAKSVNANFAAGISGPSLRDSIRGYRTPALKALG